MKIGISGAAGQLGQAVLKRVKELPGDHKVVGISRTPQSVQNADEARRGDFDRPTTLQTAYTDLDRLLIIPSIDIRYGVRARQLIAAIDAALSSGVGRIVLISDVGTRDEAEPAVGAASWVGEQHLIKSAPAWSVLRANYFMESYVEEVLLWSAVGRLAELGDNRVGFVSRDDVATAAAGILLGAGHLGAIYNATGPEALSVTDRAALMSDIVKKPIEVVQTSVDGLGRELRGAGFPEAYLGIVSDAKRQSAKGGFDIVTGDVERLPGRPPQTLQWVPEDSCRRNAR